jgi:hypothetical protein
MISCVPMRDRGNALSSSASSHGELHGARRAFSFGSSRVLIDRRSRSPPIVGGQLIIAGQTASELPYIDVAVITSPRIFGDDRGTGLIHIADAGVDMRIDHAGCHVFPVSITLLLRAQTLATWRSCPRGSEISTFHLTLHLESRPSHSDKTAAGCAGVTPQSIGGDNGKSVWAR